MMYEYVHTTRVLLGKGVDSYRVALGKLQKGEKFCPCVHALSRLARRVAGRCARSLMVCEMRDDVHMRP